MQALNGFDRQLQPAHDHDVRGDLRGIHALLAGPQRQSRDLLIGDVHKGGRQKVGTLFQVVLAETPPKVVQRAQLEVTIAQTSKTQGIADLEIVQKMIVQLFVVPAIARLEHVEAHQNVDRHIGREAMSEYSTANGSSCSRAKNSSRNVPAHEAAKRCRRFSGSAFTSLNKAGCWDRGFVRNMTHLWQFKFVACS